MTEEIIDAMKKRQQYNVKERYNISDANQKH